MTYEPSFYRTKTHFAYLISEYLSVLAARRNGDSLCHECDECAVTLALVALVLDEALRAVAHRARVARQHVANLLGLET